MRTIKQLFAAVAILSITVSCDPAGTEYFMVKNNTDKNIDISTDWETRTVPPKSEYDVTQKSGKGLGDDNAATDLTNAGLNSIKQGSLTCKKTYTTYKDWSKERIDKRTMRYTIVVEQSDF